MWPFKKKCRHDWKLVGEPEIYETVIVRKLTLEEVGVSGYTTEINAVCDICGARTVRSFKGRWTKDELTSV